jgi:hypothetical protein
VYVHNKLGKRNEKKEVQFCKECCEGQLRWNMRPLPGAGREQVDKEKK